MSITPFDWIESPFDDFLTPFDGKDVTLPAPPPLIDGGTGTGGGMGGSRRDRPSAQEIAERFVRRLNSSTEERRDKRHRDIDAVIAWLWLDGHERP